MFQHLTSLGFASLLACGLLSCATPAPVEPLSAPPVPIAQLAFLAGAWSSDENGTHSEETWMPPRGGSMMGVNRMVKDGETAYFEYLRIVVQPTGTFYLASPRGRQPVPFVLVEVSATTAVFDNPHHDYPQRIRYDLEQDGLRATISGSQNGTQGTSTWLWQRAK